VIINCDAIVFGSYQEESNNHTIMTFMQSKHGHKADPHECGHRFNIVLFDKLSPEEKDVELFSAILGDPKGYVERMGKAGYHGIVVKQKTCKLKEIKEVFSKVLYGYGFEEKLIRKVIRKTVV
jgi:hypothetical protein